MNGSAAVAEKSVEPWQLLLVAGIVILTLTSYQDTVRSAVSTWSRSETFSHGFVVLPVTLFLLWRRRAVLLMQKPVPAPAGLVVLLLAGGGWLLAWLAGIQVIQQFMVVTMVLAVVLTLLGVRFFMAGLFPLGFLYFSVPFGEALIPHMMEFTADFTVRAVQLSGIPVYRDGLFFSLPAGDFEVTKACSGVRYVIASLALGTIFAYLNYRSIYRRILFVLLSLLVPVVANGIRAYIIVMIAELSGMRLATGVDHIIYGWVFFGLVVALLFWSGLYFRDTGTVREHAVADRIASQSKAQRYSLAVFSVPVLVSVLVWPLLAGQLAGKAVEPVPDWDAHLPAGSAGWSGPFAAGAAWQPDINGTAEVLSGRYAGNGQSVDMYIYRFPSQQQGREMVNYNNHVYDSRNWFMSGSGVVKGRAGIDMKETDIRAADRKRLVWHWYRTGANDTASATVAKVYEALAMLSGRSQASYLMVLSAGYYDDREEARAVMEDFLAQNLERIGRCVTGEQAAGPDAACNE